MKKFIFVLLAITATEGSAFKPHFPDEKSFESKDKTVRLTIYGPKRTATLVDKTAKKTYQWTKAEYPHEALVLSKRKVVVLIGGLGNPGTDLGLVWVHDFDGKLIKQTNVKEMVPDIEKLSESFTRHAGPFEWVGKTEVSDDEKKLTIHVANKVPVEIAL